MYSTTESIFSLIYQRLALKLNGPQLAAEICLTKRKDASVYPSGVKITSHDGRLHIILSLYNNSDYEITHNYRWEYMDYMTGAIIKSNLDYTAEDDVVIAFFQVTLATSDEVINL